MLVLVRLSIMLESTNLVLVTNTARETFESSSLKTGLSSLGPSNRTKQGEKIIQVFLKIPLWTGIEGRHHYGWGKPKSSKDNPSLAQHTGTGEAPEHL